MDLTNWVVPNSVKYQIDSNVFIIEFQVTLQELLPPVATTFGLNLRTSVAVDCGKIDGQLSARVSCLRCSWPMRGVARRSYDRSHSCVAMNSRHCVELSRSLRSYARTTRGGANEPKQKHCVGFPFFRWPFQTYSFQVKTCTTNRLLRLSKSCICTKNCAMLFYNFSKSNSLNLMFYTFLNSMVS